MDLAGVDLPVTLVIKAPNQRVGDQTVECMLGWTVRKLKEHLKAVYPSKPVSFIGFQSACTKSTLACSVG